MSYGPLRRTADEDATIDWWGVDLCVRASEPVARHAVCRHDALTVDVVFDLAETSTFTAALARGSPYVTAHFVEATPLLASSHPMMGIVTLEDERLAPRGMCAFRVTYSLPSGKDVTWLLFFDDASVILEPTSAGTLSTAEPLTGTLRAAMVPPDAPSIAAAEDLLIGHSATYQTGSRVEWDLLPPPTKDLESIEEQLPLQAGFAAGQEAVITGLTSGAKKEHATYSFVFDVKHLGRESGDTKPLLSVALPHHVSNLDPSTPFATSLQYSTLKGPAVAVAANSWTMIEPLTSIDWFSPQGLDGNGYLEHIKEALEQDCAPDPLSGTNPGKEISKTLKAQTLRLIY